MDQADDLLREVALAESASAAGQRLLAAERWSRVTALNPVVGWYWSALGRARLEAGDTDGAIAALERAEALGDGLRGDLRFQIARAEAISGRMDAALHTLDQAIQRGLRSLAEVREEPVFAPLRDDSRFRELTGMIAPEAFSRDEGFRFDLRLLWREINRLAYEPFRHHSRALFLERIAEIDLAIPELTDLQVLIEFEKLLVLLGDGHAGVYPPADDDENRRSLPVQFFRFEEGVFVIAAATPYRQLLGAELMGIGDHSVAELERELTPLVCRDNEQWLAAVLPVRLRETPILHALGLIPDYGSAVLHVRLPNGEEARIPVDSDSVYHRSLLQRHFILPGSWVRLPETLDTPVPLYERYRGLSFWMAPLPEQRLVYAQINNIANHPAETLPDFGERLIALAEEPAFDRLVIDLRWNPGGNTFLEMPILHRLIGSKKLNQRGRLFAIIGRSTFSAAQNFSTLLERHTNAIFVGEPTGSRPTFVGETINFRLPYSGWFANVSDLLWQSGWPTDYRPWVAPQLYAPPRFALYRENRDPAMEAILGQRELLPGPAAYGDPWGRLPL